MSTVLASHRLEPISRQGDPGQGLAAPVHDPLWGLARQRAVGELAGEDTGSPVETALRMRVDPLDGWRPTAEHPVLAYDARTQVLEAVVAGESAAPVRPSGVPGAAAAPTPSGPGGLGVRDRVDAGRRLAAGLPDALVDDLRAAHPVPVGPGTPRTLMRAAALLPDGVAVAAVLLEAEAAGGATDATLATALGTTATRVGGSRGALEEVARWCATTFGLGPATWVAERLERRFEVTSGGSAVLHAPAHTREVVDTPDLELAPGADDLTLDVTDEAVQWARRLPTRLRFPGMPNDRFWEFEDARLALHRVDAATHDLARLALVEFSSTYGNDWFTFPVPVHHGTVTTVPEVVVRDTFGEFELIGVAADEQWSMFVPSGPAGGAPHLVTPSVTVAPLVGPVVEEVRFVRDENANLVWGLECVVTDEAGVVHDLVAEYTATATGAADLPTDAELVYQLMTEVPAHWVPFVPVHLDEGRRSVGLVQAVLPRPTTFGVPVLTTPRSSILRELRDDVVREEEVGSAGVTVRRRWYLARAADGSRHTWVARAVTTGRGEGASGLAFDVALDVRGH